MCVTINILQRVPANNYNKISKKCVDNWFYSKYSSISNNKTNYLKKPSPTKREIDLCLRFSTPRHGLQNTFVVKKKLHIQKIVENTFIIKVG